VYLLLALIEKWENIMPDLLYVQTAKAMGIDGTMLF
jgi:hypothetical protein